MEHQIDDADDEKSRKPEPVAIRVQRAQGSWTLRKGKKNGTKKVLAIDDKGMRVRVVFEARKLHDNYDEGEKFIREFMTGNLEYIEYAKGDKE